MSQHLWLLATLDFLPLLLLEKQYYHKKSPELLGSSGFFIYLCKQLVELHAARREGNSLRQWAARLSGCLEHNGKKGVYNALVFIH